MLLPVTSKGRESPHIAVTAIEDLAASMQSTRKRYKLGICIGIDDTDPLQKFIRAIIDALETANGVQVR